MRLFSLHRKPGVQPAPEYASEDQADWIFWFTPEGRFEAAGPGNGLFVELVLLRTEGGLREIGPRQGRSIERGTQWRETGTTGFELNDEEDLPRWGGPVLRLYFPGPAFSSLWPSMC